MTETRYRSNVGIYAVLILILFAASTMSDDSSADGTESQANQNPTQVVLDLD